MICAPGTGDARDQADWFAMRHLTGLHLIAATTLSVACLWCNTIDPALIREWRLP